MNSEAVCVFAGSLKQIQNPVWGTISVCKYYQMTPRVQVIPCPESFTGLPSMVEPSSLSEAGLLSINLLSSDSKSCFCLYIHRNDSP